MKMRLKTSASLTALKTDVPSSSILTNSRCAALWSRAPALVESSTYSELSIWTKYHASSSPWTMSVPPARGFMMDLTAVRLLAAVPSE